MSKAIKKFISFPSFPKAIYLSNTIGKRQFENISSTMKFTQVFCILSIVVSASACKSSPRDVKITRGDCLDNEKFTLCYRSKKTCAQYLGKHKDHEHGKLCGECETGCNCKPGYIKTVNSRKPGHCISYYECRKRDNDSRHKHESHPKPVAPKEGKHDCLQNEYWTDCFNGYYTCDNLMVNLINGTISSIGGSCGTIGCDCKPGYVKTEATEKPGFCIEREECIRKYYDALRNSTKGDDKTTTEEPTTTTAEQPITTTTVEPTITTTEEPTTTMPTEAPTTMATASPTTTTEGPTTTTTKAPTTTTDEPTSTTTEEPTKSPGDSKKKNDESPGDSKKKNDESPGDSKKKDDESPGDSKKNEDKSPGESKKKEDGADPSDS